MFRKLLTLDEARTAIANLKLKALDNEQVPLQKAHNRILANDVKSTLDIPPFDRSTVDGYAVKASSTFGADEKTPITLTVRGVVNIGELPESDISAGEAAEIVTGAPIPEGSDAVVMVEDTERTGAKLRVISTMTKGENVMKKGTDIKQGVIVLKAGQVLGSREIGVLAALGLAKIRVRGVPRVAVLSTGGEVYEPGKELPPGKIYDINAYTLYAAVFEADGTPLYLGVAPDEKEKLHESLLKALENADMVLTSGGVSVGPKDLMPMTVATLGKPGLVFSGIAVKPGKPTTVALVEGKAVFALPGHPASALLIFHLLVRPVIWRLSGRPEPQTEKARALTGMRFFSAKGRRTFVMVKLRKNEEGKLVADAVESGASGAITTLTKADGYVEIPEDEQFVEKYEEIEVTLF